MAGRWKDEGKGAMAEIHHEEFAPHSVKKHDGTRGKRRGAIRDKEGGEVAIRLVYDIYQGKSRRLMMGVDGAGTG